MNYLTSLLLGVLNTESEESVNYSIAKCLLDHIGELGDYNATKIAKLCNVSKAAISRFCKFLGLEDFMELQVLCRNSQRPTNIKFLYESKEKTDDWMGDYLNAQIHILENLKKNIRKDILEKLVRDIYNYKKVAIFGHMQSGNVAMNLQHDLTAANHMVFSTHKFSIQKEYIEQADEDTLIIVFSASGRYFEHLFPTGCMELDGPGKPKIYMITVSPLSNKKYIDCTIRLCDNYDYATSILAMQSYASLVALRFHNEYNLEP